MMVVVAACMAILIAAGPSRDSTNFRWVAGGLCVVAGAVLGGVLVGIAVAGSIWAVMIWRRGRAKNSSANDEGANELLAIEVVALAVSAGLPFRSAASLTAETVGGEVGDEMFGALRRSQASLQSTFSFDVVASMFRMAERSESTGAALGPAVSALASDLRQERATVVRERLSRLPVKLLFPLAFLILPGFVLMTVAPPIVGGLSRLGL